MGLSVSAAAGIVMIGVILIFGTLYPAIESSTKLKNEARSEWSQWQEAKQRADMTITNVSHTDEQLNISLKNTGDTTLKVDELEVLVDGTYRSENINHTVVAGNINNTNLWNPGQNLTITLEKIEKENVQRVSVVDEFGSETYHSEVK